VVLCGHAHVNHIFWSWGSSFILVPGFAWERKVGGRESMLVGCKSLHVIPIMGNYVYVHENDGS
jgi:hypothetical protein